MIRKSPVFTVLAAVSLALGIGANTAIYSFMDAILLRSMPVPDPESLALVQFHTRGFPDVAHNFSGSNYKDARLGMVSGNIPYPAYEALRSANTVFSSLFGFAHAGKLNMLVGSVGDLGQTELMTGDGFRTLGLRPAAGRFFDDTEDHFGASAVAVLSYRYAERRFGDAGKAVGRAVLLNNVPFTIAGVTAPDFQGMYPGSNTDIYLPMHASAAFVTSSTVDPNRNYIERNRYWVQVIGRLRPGVTLAQAQAALAPVFQNFVNSTATTAKERADLPQFYLQAAAGGMDFLRRRYTKPLYVLMTLVGLILAIACANLANLLLARAAGRRREMAVRLSLGAPRSRIIRQLLTESSLLALIGGAMGILVASWGINLLSVLLANGDENFVLNAQMSWRVLAVTMAVSIGAGLVFGLAPALQASGVDLTPALKTARGGGPVRRGWWRASLSRVLIVSQIAISLFLLVAAGLFVRTLSNLHAIPTGFNEEHVLLFSVNAWQVGHRGDAQSPFYEKLRESLSAIPGVRSASFTDTTLISNSANTTQIKVAGGSPVGVHTLTIGPSFFQTLEIPILLGRDFNAADSNTGRVLVNELLARTVFPNQNPLGRHLTIDGGNKPIDLEIVGVVKSVRYASLKSEIPRTVYRACCADARGMTFTVRTAGDPLAAVSAARELVRQADSRLPVTGITTQQRVVEQNVGQERTFATLCTGFAILALVIASLGLYGTMAYNVARRTGEIGIRMALGAQRRTVLWMMQREVLVLAAVGLAIGLPAAYLSATVVESFLFGVKGRDVLTMSVAPAVLLLAAIAAGWGPARRASKIDPMAALRED
jgi:predicted permease